MKMLQKTLIAAAVALSAPAFAAIAPANTGNGELFLVMYNPDAEVSLAMDLGEHINDFRAAYDFNTGATMTSKSWTIDGSNAELQKFVAKAGATSAWRWFVLAGDSVGSTSVFGGRGLLTTLTAGQDASTIETMSNLSYNAIMGPLNTYLLTTNQLGDAGMATGDEFAPNGVAFGDLTNGAYALKFGFPGNNGASFATFTNDNGLGDSSVLQYVTRNVSSNLATVKTDLFDNAYGASSFSLNASAGNGYTLSFTTAVPEPGTYALLLAGLATVGAIARRRKA